MKRSIAIISVLLGATMLLGGCGSSSSTSNQQSKAAKSDTLTYGIAGDPGNSVNVITTEDRFGLMEIKALYSPLYMYNANKVVYFLADSMTVSSDNLTYTAKLRKNVKWSDGKPFTADDVVFTYDEMLKQSNAGWAYSQLIFDGKPVQVVKVDDYTVKFILPKASSSAMELLGDIFIMPKHIYATETNFANSSKNATPVGTGPYKLSLYKAGQYVKFVKNDTYFLGASKIKNVIFRIIGDANTALLSLEKGEINSLIVQPSDISKLKSDANLTIKTYDEGRVAYMAFNLKSKTVANKAVRQAVSYALNRTELIDASYISDAYAKPVYSFLPNESKYSTTDVQKYTTDDSKSKQLLATAGVSNLTLKLAYTGNDVAQQKQAVIVQQELKTAGINVQLEAMDGTALSEKLINHSGDFDMYLDGYIMGIGPDTFSSLFTTGSTSNFMSYSDPQVDSLFAQGQVETNDAKRTVIYANLQKLIQDDAVFYPITENKRILAISSNIGGIDQASLVPVYTFEDMSKLYFK